MYRYITTCGPWDVQTSYSAENIIALHEFDDMHLYELYVHALYYCNVVNFTKIVITYHCVVFTV